MIYPQLLGQLSATHQMLNGLIESTTETDCYHSFHPCLAPLAWYLGRCVYEETYWLREVIHGDSDLTTRVQDLFAQQALPTQEQCSRLPPKEHLLNWAMEIQDENVRLLATPGALPKHQMLLHDRVLHHILQHHHHVFETMVMTLAQRQLQHTWQEYQVTQPLVAHEPIMLAVDVSQGHYRIGAKDQLASYDHELPAQMIQLSSFRISQTPVSNSEFLSFMQDGGYEQQQYWDDAGWNWLQNNSVSNPSHWRQDNAGRWFGIGLNGPADLVAKEPVMGINQHEAKAYAAWVSKQGGGHDGAVLQHEYQWEIAVRMQAISEFGKVWEWCANQFFPYTDYEPSKDGILSSNKLDTAQISLRGHSIYTQASLRRPSFRNCSAPNNRHILAGMRLVYPPQENI